jgi:hypothetical protein
MSMITSLWPETTCRQPQRTRGRYHLIDGEPVAERMHTVPQHHISEAKGHATYSRSIAEVRTTSTAA